jgi:hypothetical protein
MEMGAKNISVYEHWHGKTKREKQRAKCGRRYDSLHEEDLCTFFPKRDRTTAVLSPERVSIGAAEQIAVVSRPFIPWSSMIFDRGK